jgi:hypothetical protein
MLLKNDFKGGSVSNIDSKTGSSTQYGIKTLVMRIRLLRRRRTQPTFSTASVKTGKAQTVQMCFGLPPESDSDLRVRLRILQTSVPHNDANFGIGTLYFGFSRASSNFARPMRCCSARVVAARIYQMKIQREVVMPDQPSIPKFANERASQ